MSQALCCVPGDGGEEGGQELCPPAASQAGKGMQKMNKDSNTDTEAKRILPSVRHPVFRQ